MIESAVSHNRLTTFFQQIISVDRVKTYKPSPRVTPSGLPHCNLPAPEISSSRRMPGTRRCEGLRLSGRLVQPVRRCGR